MMKYLLIFLSLLSFNCSAETSYSDAQDLLNKLNGKPMKLEVMEASFVNAFGEPGHVIVTRGLLNNINRDEMIAVLAHELGHASGIDSEVGADIASVGIAKKAGLDVCPGARQFLLTYGKKGGGSHPPGLERLQKMGCI